MYDPRSGSTVWGKLLLPEWFHGLLSRDKKTLIAQAEGIVGTAVYRSLEQWHPGVLRDRVAFHWIDNTTALSALVNGSASQPDMAFIVSAHHIFVHGLACHVQYRSGSRPRPTSRIGRRGRTSGT